MPRKTHMCLAAAVTVATLLAAGCGGNGAGSSTGAVGAAGTPQAKAAGAAGNVGVAKAASPTSPSTSPTPSPSATVDPGTLPQTNEMPSGQDPQFQAGAQQLWQAIVQDKPELARPFFFPLSAYMQVKSIWNPAEDYKDRLIAWYDLDIQAAHDHLGADVATAKFTSMNVPEGNAEWIGPGVEYNKGSYYRVYGTRLNYQVNGHDASIGVFSLISWRGEWYVVHLGPSTRSATEGIVYDAWD